MGFMLPLESSTMPRLIGASSVEKYVIFCSHLVFEDLEVLLLESADVLAAIVGYGDGNQNDIDIDGYGLDRFLVCVFLRQEHTRCRQRSTKNGDERFARPVHKDEDKILVLWVCGKYC